MTMKRWGVITVSTVLVGCAFQSCTQDSQPHPVTKESIQYEQIDGALIYDYDPSTKLGDDIFGTVIADLENDAPGRCSHGGPVCMEYPNGNIVAFYFNSSDHNDDGWSEYAVSKDGGRNWEKYNKFQYSFEAYKKNPKRPVIVEEGLVTQNGTVVLFLTHLGDEGRSKSGIMKSSDNGSTWTDYESLDGDFVGYPCAVAVTGSTNYVMFDISSGPHVLYVSTDDGKNWEKRSTLTLDDDKWYGTMCVMEDGRLLAGAYTEKDEQHFYYCISTDQGQTWGEQERAYVDKMIRDPELAYLSGQYYLHGRSGQVGGEGSHRFVLYQSDDGIKWQDGIIVSGDTLCPDGYSHNCIINQYNDDVPNELMVEYSIIYDGAEYDEVMSWDKSDRGSPGHQMDTNEYVFFIKPEPEK